MTIVRTDPSDVGVRQIITRVDEGARVTLVFGDSVSEEVPPGPHRLRVHNTLFWKTVPFAVEPGEHVEFTVINRSGRLSLGALALVGAAPLYLTVRSRRVSPGD